MKYYLFILVPVLLWSCDLFNLSRQEIIVNVKSVESINVNQNTKVKFALFGYDTKIADQPASLLQEYVFDLEKIPKKINFYFDRALNSKISPAISDDFGYYMIIYVDIDNNGIIDNNDAVEDFENTQESFSGQGIEGLPKDIYIKMRTDGLTTSF